MGEFAAAGVRVQGPLEVCPLHPANGFGGADGPSFLVQLFLCLMRPWAVQSIGLRPKENSVCQEVLL